MDRSKLMWHLAFLRHKQYCAKGLDSACGRAKPAMHGWKAPPTPTCFAMTASTAGGEFDLLEQYGDDLDIIADYQALQAIEGQLDGVLPR